jgi:hypothetical protein
MTLFVVCRIKKDVAGKKQRNDENKCQISASTAYLKTVQVEQLTRVEICIVLEISCYL